MDRNRKIEFSSPSSGLMLGGSSGGRRSAGDRRRRGKPLGTPNPPTSLRAAPASAPPAARQPAQPLTTNAYLVHRRGRDESETKKKKKTGSNSRWGLKLRAAASDGNPSGVAEVMEDARYRGEADGVIDMPDRWGFTACIGAAMFGRIDVLEMLMEHGAKLDLTTDAGETALHWGSLNGHTEVCALLLSAGADPNAQQVKGKTPLMLASEQGFDEIVQLQVDAGAECAMRDKSNRTALEYAIENGHERCIEILRNASARRVQLQYLEKRRECEEIRLKADALRDTVQRLEAESDCLKEIVAKEERRIIALEAEVDAAHQRGEESDFESDEVGEEPGQVDVNLRKHSQQRTRGRKNQSFLTRMMIESEINGKGRKKKGRMNNNKMNATRISSAHSKKLHKTPNALLKKKPKWQTVV